MASKSASFDWKEYSLKGIARILIGLAVLLLLFFVVVCLIYFPPRGMSSSLSSLGLYGDYFGGIVGGITSVATLGVTIYLALALHRLEKENAESAIETQRQVAIMQMKFNQLAAFKSNCEEAFKKLRVGYPQCDMEMIREGGGEIDININTIRVLFPELENFLSTHFNDIHRAIHSLIMLTFSFTKEEGLKHKEVASISINEYTKKLNEVSKEYWLILSKLSKWAKD